MEQIEQTMEMPVCASAASNLSQATLDDYTKNLQHLFYIDWDWKEKGELDGLFKNYFTRFVTGYEISKEKQVKHIQCFTIGPPTRYRAFIAKYKADYKKAHGKEPVGRAPKGGRKNYGKVREIKKSHINCIAYCIKDGEYSHYNIDKATMMEAENTTYQIDSIDKRKNIIHNFLQQNKHLWKESAENKFEIMVKITKLHFEAFGYGIKKATLDKYLLSSGLVSYRVYTQQFKNLCYQYEEY